ncbi:hypothetical protein [Companilactobacillus paralimentarius]|jgi:hypothetical protein|nr:hypothetical protein [Companilactobacillus paralimentarius]MDR4934619.1 hypothetical protein [Companilactobacillus paralimentarius]
MNEDASKVVSVEMLPDFSLMIEYSDGTKEHAKSILSDGLVGPDDSFKNK